MLGRISARRARRQPVVPVLSNGRGHVCTATKRGPGARANAYLKFPPPWPARTPPVGKLDSGSYFHRVLEAHFGARNPRISAGGRVRLDRRRESPYHGCHTKLQPQYSGGWGGSQVCPARPCGFLGVCQTNRQSAGCLVLGAWCLVLGAWCLVLELSFLGAARTWMEVYYTTDARWGSGSGTYPPIV